MAYGIAESTASSWAHKTLMPNLPTIWAKTCRLKPARRSACGLQPACSLMIALLVCLLTTSLAFAAGYVLESKSGLDISIRQRQQKGGFRDWCPNDCPLPDAPYWKAEDDRVLDDAAADVAVAVSLTWLGAHANWRGEFTRAIETSQQAAAAAREINDGLSEMISSAFTCLSQIGLGQYPEALATIDDGLAKARDRNNSFIVGRLTNTLGWLYQELGDFRRATEYNREAAEIGRRAKNANVEVSSLINLSLDELNLGDPRRALALMEETHERVEKSAFDAHRWRWSNHLSAYLSEALLAIDERERALEQADKALRQARNTGSLKYQAKALALRGQIFLETGRLADARRELAEALTLTRRIGYPTLTWQAAHLLALAQAAEGDGEQAVTAARLAADTLDQIAGRLPDAAQRRTFLAWRRVNTVREDVERLLRRSGD